KVEALQAELADIERATMTVPMRHSDLYFMLRYHLDQIRSRLIKASDEIAMAQMAKNEEPINGKPTVSDQPLYDRANHVLSEIGTSETLRRDPTRPLTRSKRSCSGHHERTDSDPLRKSSTKGGR